MMPQTGQQMIAIQTVPNISRTNSNQAMNFGQLTEYNTRNVFLDHTHIFHVKSYQLTKC